MNNDSDYRVSLAWLPAFDEVQPAMGELALLEACLPELVAALLDTVTDEEK